MKTHASSTRFVIASVIVCVVASTLSFTALPVFGQTTQRGSSPTRVSDIPPNVRKEMASLSSDDAGTRAMAATALGEMGATANPAIPLLIALISDYKEVLVLGGTTAGRKTVGDVALESLRALGEPARLALLKAAAGENPAGAIKGLGRLEEKRAVPILERQLLRPDRDSHVVSQSVQALRKISGPASFDMFAKALLVPTKDEDASEMAGALLGAMIDIDKSRAVEPAIEWLGVASPRAVSYGSPIDKLHDPRLAPPLVEYLRRGAFYLDPVIGTLGELGDPHSVDVLIDLMDRKLTSDNSRVLYSALQRLTGQSFGNMNKTQALAWWQANRARIIK